MGEPHVKWTVGETIMSDVLANYIDSFFDASFTEPRVAAGGASETVTITPMYVMGLTLAIISSSIAEVCPLQISKRRPSTEYLSEMDDEIPVIATAQWIVPAAHPLYVPACHYNGYSLGVRIRDLAVLLACDAVGCDITLRRSTGNWRSQKSSFESGPRWLLATFPQYGYALISPSHLLATVR